MVTLQVRQTQLKNLEDNFSKGRSKKTYTEQQIELIKESIKHLDDQEFTRMCKWFIGNLRTLPLPKHFEQMASRFKTKSSTWNNGTQHKSYSGFTCSHCQDTGDCWVTSTRDGISFTTWMNCFCSKGLSGTVGLPRYERGMSGVRLEEYPKIFFQPGKAVEGVQELISSKQQARLYWQQGVDGQQEEECIDFSK